MWPPCFGGTEVQMQGNLMGLWSLCHCPGTNVPWRADVTVLDLNKPQLNLPAENFQEISEKSHWLTSPKAQ